MPGAVRRDGGVPFQRPLTPAPDGRRAGGAVPQRRPEGRPPTERRPESWQAAERRPEGRPPTERRRESWQANDDWPGSRATNHSLAPAQPESRRAARLHGPHPEPGRRAPAPANRRVEAVPEVPLAPVRVSAEATPAPRTRRELREKRKAPKRNLARPALAGGLTIGLAASAVAYAGGIDLGTGEAAFVVGSQVSTQTTELAKARTVDTTYRAAASVSRNERRTAITVAGARDAAELEAKAKAEAARKAREAEEARRRAELEAMRQQAIANARENPQAAARVLMVDHGWTSDAQYNCLVNLWNGESNWNYLAENPSSGAYGIPQSLPGSKMSKFGDDWRTNPITQIEWGLWYIDEVYGSPCNAWSTWQSRSPHWY